MISEEPFSFPKRVYYLNSDDVGFLSEIGYLIFSEACKRLRPNFPTKLKHCTGFGPYCYRGERDKSEWV